MNKRYQKEISKLNSLPILALAANAHNGLDWVHSLIDGHSEVGILPAFSFFRFTVREKINEDMLNNKKKLILKISNILYKNKSYLVPRRKFFSKLKEKKIFETYLKIYLSNQKEVSFRSLFFAIHFAYLKVKKENIMSKKIIVSHEHMCWNHHKYSIFKNVKFCFVIRDPRAAFAGSILQMKKVNKYFFLESSAMNKILLNYIAGWKFIKNEKLNNPNNIFFFINEKMNKDLKNEMTKFCKWSKISFKISMLKSTFNKKLWKGESSYLMKKKIDLNKKVPKNYYNLEKVKKRWMSLLSLQEIKIIEAFCYDYMKVFGYKKNYVIKFYQIYINKFFILFFYILPKMNKDKNFLYQLIKNTIKRLLILLLPMKSINILSIK